MSDLPVRIRELVAWELDSYPYRCDVLDQIALSRAQECVARCSPFEQPDPVLDVQPEALRELFGRHAERPDLLSEMSGLRWSLGVIDLRALVAFQRRLVFPIDTTPSSAPKADDWPALFALSFGVPKPIVYQTIHDSSAHTVSFVSSNPDLHLRVTHGSASPFTLHAGSPFFEVASFRDRWFLRDGYHRAYALLRAQVFAVPAVLVHATTLEELGANRAWFFPEDILFSRRPPLVTDFLHEDLVMQYERPALLKTVRVTIEEELTPSALRGEPS